MFQDTKRKLTPRVAKNFKESLLPVSKQRRKKQSPISHARSSEYTQFPGGRGIGSYRSFSRFGEFLHLEHGGRGEKRNREKGKKFAGGIRHVADPPTNLNPLRSNLAVVGRESGRVNIGAVSFNEPCAPLLFRKRARRRSFGRKRFASAAAAPRNGAKFMRPTGLKPIECLSARFGLNGTRLLPDIRKYRPTVSRLIQTRWSIRTRGEKGLRLLARFPRFHLFDIDTFLI